MRNVTIQRLGSAGRRLARRFTAPLRPLPDFVVIGVMKGGTTSLFEYLLQHPRVAGGHRKELHFFDLNFRNETSAYRAHFPYRHHLRAAARAAGGPIRLGEASPYYVFHPGVPERLHRTLPEARLICLLRDPVSRAYSHYHHSVRRGYEDRSFAEALALESERLSGEEERILRDPGYSSAAHRHHSYFTRGLYADQLERWTARFDPDRLLLLRSEDFFADPVGQIHHVLEFLGLPSWTFDVQKAHKSVPYPPMDAGTRAALRQRFEEPNARLRDRFGDRFHWGD